MIKSTLTKTLGSLGAFVPSMPEVSLTRDAEVTLYMVHHSGDAEDYTFLIDFTAFMAESQSGVFSRPVLKIWAGRSDFDRARFARHLREAFSAEFQRLREERRKDTQSKTTELVAGALARAGDYIALLLLYAAVESTRTVTRLFLSAAGLGGVAEWMQRGKPDAKIEAAIEEKKRIVDAALARLEIRLHRDLYVHAYRGLPPGPLTGMDYDAWPLPDFVRTHLEAPKSTSWW